MEGVVHDGWLVKSPPEKTILKAKWRQRWFVLRHSGLLPGQFILEYFTDNTCKKLKGKIDLDQCEQVDAGLTFESKKTSYQFMFDIRTPKRIYYLVAETEAAMNKWVDCICSVCGLKIHVEEGSIAASESSSLNSLSMLSQGLLSSTTILSSVGYNNNYLVPPESSSTTPSMTASRIRSETTLTKAKSSSNPYIPISECHTGKPVPNGNLPLGDGFKDLPKEAPPPPPKTEWSSQELVNSGEFYDYPRPLNPQGGFDQFAADADEEDTTYKVPLQLKSDFSANANGLFNTLPPRVNWSTYPQDSNMQHLSSTVPRKPSVDKTECAEYDIVPSFHGPNKEPPVTRKNVQDLASHFENISLKSSDLLFSPVDNATSSQSIEGGVVPPRPPKPSKMRDRCQYENFELPHQLAKDDEPSAAYDVPATSKGMFLNKQLPVQAFSFLKNESGDDLSPSTKVPLSSSVGKENLVMDDTYDFPKFRSEDNINATVPLVPNVSTSQRQRRHAYTNAPPGLFNGKDLIFNYEYRPSLMTADGYLSGDTLKSEPSAYTPAGTITPPSPSVIGAYANLPTSPTAASYQNDIPPAVNRELKPRRVSSNEDRGSISFLTLQPPPVCRSRTKANKRSFRKPRAAPSPTPMSSLNGMPPVPNRFRHHPDVSTTSDDELSNSSGSRRNSSNDDQTRHFFNTSSKKDEIQYLDLDLESEPSPSPKSPERMTASTVYKKVDFVKTKAFNEMRQNVEESYRKSQ